MGLQKLNFRPGIVKDTTGYANEGGYYDGDKVRFRAGFPESIGGWVKLDPAQFLGDCRALHQWTALDGTNYTALGTNLKLYLEVSGSYNDITPIRETQALGNNPFATQNTTDGKLTLTDTAHGAIYGDFVTFSGATAFDNYTTGLLNAEHQIIQIIDANSYTVEVGGVVSAVFPASGGGAGITAAYQINPGPTSQNFGFGWGAGPWGRGTWGSLYSSGVSAGQLRLWSLDNFGEDLVANIRGGGIYFWDKTSGVSARAVELASLPGSNQAPTIASEIMVSDKDRSLIAFACNENGSTTQDLLLVRWSSSEDLLEWEPDTTNTAGGKRISSGSQFITACRTRQGIAIWTDQALHAMSWTGPPAHHVLDLMAENNSIAGPNAMAEAWNTMYWMDFKEFRKFDGAVSTVPCTVQDYVFGDINLEQRYKIFSVTNTLNDEIWWFYPSANSVENDRYAIFNGVENVWSVGFLGRTAGLDRSFNGYPIMAANGYLYTHEFGYNADDVPLESFIEAADIDLVDGEQFYYIGRFIPDVTIKGTNETGIVNYIFKRRNSPGQSFVTGYSSQVTPTTEEVGIRVRGRQFALRIESNQANMGWRLGATRVGIQADGGKP